MVIAINVYFSFIKNFVFVKKWQNVRFYVYCNKWNIVESGVEHHNPNPVVINMIIYFSDDYYTPWFNLDKPTGNGDDEGRPQLEGVIILKYIYGIRIALILCMDNI